MLLTKDTNTGLFCILTNEDGFGTIMDGLLHAYNTETDIQAKERFKVAWNSLSEQFNSKTHQPL